MAAMGIVAALLLFAPTLIGWVVRRLSATLAGVLYQASPWLNAAALAVTVFATRQNVAAVLDLALS
jgi:hypothetical protein